MRHFLLTSILCGLCAGEVSAGNLLYNSSFELGERGYSGQRNSMLDAEGNYKYTGKAFAVDSSTFKSGSSSMKLENSTADQVIFGTHEFPVREAAKYTVSFWAKSDTEGYELTGAAISAQKAGDELSHSGIAKTFKLTKEWTRYNFDFSAKKGHSAYWMRFECGQTGKEPFTAKGNIWLDDLQAEEGKLTDWSPASNVEVAVYADSGKLNVITEDSISCEYKAISYKGDSELSGLIELNDLYYKKLLYKHKISSKLYEGKPVSDKLKIENIPFGYFEISSVNDKHQNTFPSSAFFIRVPQPENHITSSGEKGFKLGAVGSFDGVVRYATKNSIIAFHDGQGTQKDLAEGFKLAGNRIFREWDEKHYWADFEPEPGKYMWDRPDRIVNSALSKNIGFMVCLGGVFSDKHPHPRLPAWLCKKDRLGNPGGTNLVGRKDSLTVLPPLEDWRRYVRVIATRYKGKIPYYEIFNEPNLWITAPYYMEYLTAASEEIRKADPEAKIVGICTTEDKGADMRGFLGECLRLGAGKYMDIITFHPYGSAMDDSAFPAMNAIRGTKKMIASFGKEIPLWNGEMYYATPERGNHYKFNEYDFAADALARRSIIDMGEGVDAAAYLHINSFYKCNITPSNYFWEDSMEWNPSDKFAAQSGSGYFLNGAEPVKTVEIPGGILGYAFRNNGRFFLAIWTISEKAELSVKAPQDMSLKTYDFFGNPIEKEAASFSVKLTRAPLYVEFVNKSGFLGLGGGKIGKDDEDDILKSLDKLNVRFENDYRIRRAVLLKEGKEASIVLSMVNTSGREIKENTVKLNSDEFAAKSKAIAGLVKPLEGMIVAIPVELRKEDLETVKALLTIEGSERKFSAPLNLSVKQTLSLSERVFSPWQKIGRKVSGKADAPEAFFAVAFDRNEIIVKVSVKDGKAAKDGRVSEAVNPWDDDDVEIFIDSAPFAPELGNTYQLHVTPRRPEGKRIHGALPDLKETVKLFEGGYEAEIRIPADKIRNLLPLQGKSIGFDIALDVSNGRERISQTVWTGSGDNYRDRNALGVLNFKTQDMGRIDIAGLDGMEFKYTDGSYPLKGGPAGWLGDRKNARLITTFPAKGEWTSYSFSFIPEKTGLAELNLMGDWTKNPAEMPLVEFRNIRIEGAALANGDFSRKDEKGNPKNWGLRGKPLLNGNGALVSHDNNFVQRIPCEGGKEIKVSFEVMYKGKVGK